MQNNKREKNYKAFGLLESVVAIGVFGVTIIMGLSLIVKSLRVIKENQISDQTAAVMISSLEFVRSPQFPVTDLRNGSYYKVKIDTMDSSVEGIEEVASSGLTINNCTPSSEFFIDIDGDESFVTFCNQISVEYSDSTNPNSDFLIRSRVVYSVGGGVQIAESEIASEGFKLREAVGFKKRNL